MSRALLPKLIPGLLDLFKATGDDYLVIWAIQLQKRQDELFWDEKDGGYFAAAEDEHVLVRMKEAQVGHSNDPLHVA